MTLENARVLYKHRKGLGKDVSDIERRYPELKEAPKPLDPSEKKEQTVLEKPQEVKPNGKKPKRRTNKRNGL